MKNLLQTLETLNEMLEENNISAMSISEAKDWISGDESYEQLKDIVNTLFSEYQTTKAENRNSWRYQH